MSVSVETEHKATLSDYRDKYAGCPAAVLGGGPSLPADMARLPLGCLFIAVNYHAEKLCQPDFMVYNDQPESDPRLLVGVCQTKAVRVSPDPSSDVFFDVPVWTGNYSSHTATWFALWLGCDPVILCGHDLYQGERVYFHDYEHDCPAFHYPLENHLRPWIEEGRNLLPHVERVRAMSGPLGQVFGYYQEGGR